MSSEGDSVTEKGFDKISGSNPYGNQNKLLWHMPRICEFLNSGSTFPIQVELNPTNNCNMACKWCLTEYAHKKEDIDIGVLKKFLKEFAELGGRSIDWTGGGEPSIYPHIGEAIEYASEVGLKQGMMTNGLFNSSLVDILVENMTWVRFSLDSTDNDSYCEMKGVGHGAMKRVLENMRSMCEFDKRPRVVANVNLSMWNYPHLEQTVIDAREQGIDGFQVRPVLPGPGGKISQEEIGFYRDVVGKLEALKKHERDGFQVFFSYDKFLDMVSGDVYLRPYDKCQYHQFIVVLNANGDLCVCTHHLGDERFTFGNVYDHSVREIWESDMRGRTIEYCNQLDFSECQVCCKGHELNKLLFFIQNPNPRSDPDFF
jgi:cyclic pyranopterin phosphate synthase